MSVRRRRAGRRGGVGALAGATTALFGLALGLVGATPAQADQVRDLQYWLTDYGFTKAWEVTKGAGVTVAVIDTGVDGSVAELKGTVIGGTDVSGIGSANGQKPVGEGDEHGTLVASLLAGRGTGSSAGVIGVAPAASILSVSVAFGTDTGSTVSNDDQIAQAVRWAVDNGADVINMSLTRNTLSWPVSWDDAFSYAFDNDVVVVAAAGNRGSGTTQVGAPATIPGVLTVAGVDRSKEASFDASSQGISIAVAAPSEQLVGVVPGGGYVSWNGTSAATPLVAGLVALVRAAHPELDAANVIQRVIATAKPDGHTVPSPIYGYGLIDAAAAVTATVEPVEVNPMGSLAEWIHLHRRADADEPVETEPAVPVTPVPDPVNPDAEAIAAGEGSPYDLTLWAVPLAAAIGFGMMVALLGIGAIRHFRRIRGI